MSPADQESSYRAIESLIATYAELVDDGDFAAVGLLLADATFTGGAGSVRGRDAIEKMLRDNVIVYDDGTPRTKHVTTNLAIEVDEEGGTAISRSSSPRCRRCPTWRCSPSSAVGTTTASSAATGTGVSWRGASERISSAT
jgi:ketosteroid isomerase-like protein